MLSDIERQAVAAIARAIWKHTRGDQCPCVCGRVRSSDEFRYCCNACALGLASASGHDGGCELAPVDCWIAAAEYKGVLKTVNGCTIASPTPRWFDAHARFEVRPRPYIVPSAVPPYFTFQNDGTFIIPPLVIEAQS